MEEAKKAKVWYAFVAPFLLLFLNFTVLPVLIAIFFSFTYFNMLQPPEFVGVQNYLRLFLRDDVFLLAVKNTFVFAAITGPLSY
ncbi:MAG: sugar ABC transporter permease, partial [bacterium]